MPMQMDAGIPIDEYSLHIWKGARGDYFEHFDTLDELKSAIANNLTEQEIAAGIIDHLCDFGSAEMKDGCAETFWTDNCMSMSITVCAYKKFEASYKVLGPTDSKRDGYFNSKTDGPCTGRIELETPMGTLIAEVAGDQSYPGFCLSLRRPGKQWEQTVALLECPDDDMVVLHRWDDKAIDGADPIDSVVLTRKDEQMSMDE